MSLGTLYTVGFIVVLLTLRSWSESKRHRLAAIVSLFVYAMLLSPLLVMASPVDWIFPTKSVRASAQFDNLTVHYVQEPGSDFYRSTVEFTGSSGNSGFFAVDGDSSKCWVGWAVTTDTTVEFHCFPGGLRTEVPKTLLAEEAARCSTTPCDRSGSWYVYHANKWRLRD